MPLLDSIEYFGYQTIFIYLLQINFVSLLLGPNYLLYP